MARYNDRECAWCAADLDSERYLIGINRKVYCGAVCAETGVQMSACEDEWLRRQTVDRHGGKYSDPIANWDITQYRER